MKTELLALTTRPQAPAPIGAEAVTVPAGVSLAFQRNLFTMIRALLAQSVPCGAETRPSADESARGAVEMLLKEFPKLKDFERLRALGKLYAANDFRPLKLVRAPAELDTQDLSEELACRFYEGWFVLADDEALVFQNGFAQGPFERRKAFDLAKRLSAASPTNDPQGHILDPEIHQPVPASVLLPNPDPVQQVCGP